MSRYVANPVQDSEEMAAHNFQICQIDKPRAAALAAETVTIWAAGTYVAASGEHVDIRTAVQKCKAGTLSIPPLRDLTRHPQNPLIDQMLVSVVNTTTQAAARVLREHGHSVLALNFANGTNPGGWFLDGGRTQEEALCRDSLLYGTLVGHEMYDVHKTMPYEDASDWCIVSRDVPFIRDENSDLVAYPWVCDVVTCAAPISSPYRDAYCRELFRKRIRRLLEVAASLGYTGLVLGAWGCGMFGNDPASTAKVFRELLEDEFLGCFGEVVFAVTDWSPERKFLGPFANALLSNCEQLPTFAHSVIQRRQPSQMPTQLVADDANRVQLMACAAYAATLNTFDVTHLEPWLHEDVSATSSATCAERHGKADYVGYYAQILAGWSQQLDVERPARVGEIGWHYDHLSWCVLIHGNGDEGVTNVWIPSMLGDVVHRIYVENAFAIGPVVATSIYPSGGVNDISHLLGA
jgi:uncharacterized protein (TIGR02452 family)